MFKSHGMERARKLVSCQSFGVCSILQCVLKLAAEVWGYDYTCSCAAGGLLQGGDVHWEVSDDVQQQYSHPLSLSLSLSREREN